MQASKIYYLFAVERSEWGSRVSPLLITVPAAVCRNIIELLGSSLSRNTLHLHGRHLDLPPGWVYRLPGRTTNAKRR